MPATDQDNARPVTPPIVGIDLGTTNSLVAVMREGAPVILADSSVSGRPTEADGAPSRRALLLPSVVRYSPDGSRAEAVGWAAKDSAPAYPGRTVFSAKRLMGRSARDAAPDAVSLPYEVAEGPGATARVRIGGRLISPQEVSAVVLRALRDRASRALGVEVSRAVITVPAYFDDAQRQATRDAARLAGIDAARIINEPTAAALAYGVGLRLSAPKTVAVYDLGGGTFDISILRVTPAAPGAAEGDPAFFEVLATAGDTRLGGDDFDQALFAMLAKEIGRPLSPPEAQELRDAAERAKVELSQQDAARVRLGGFARAITRAEFEALIRPWAERTLSRCRQALRDAGLSPADIDTVALVGGSTRIPLIRRLVGEFFGRTPYTALDPDLVVALGAAVQAGLLDGTATGAMLLDVLPLSLGVETVGGGVAKLIVRNQSVPARAVEMFSTSVDGQTSIKLNVLQGEREMAGDCRSLGQFHLRGIPPMPAGLPQVEVEFLVDANGILSVSARERRSGAEAQLQVVPNHGLTREEVDRMEADAFAHARDDMRRHRVADLVVNSRMDIKWVCDALRRVRAALAPDYVRDLESRLTALEALAAQAESDWRAVDPDGFHRAKEALDKASVRLHEVAITESLRR